MPQKLQNYAILEIHEILLPQNSLPYNILLMPKEGKSIFIDKIMAGCRKQNMIGQTKLTCI